MQNKITWFNSFIRNIQINGNKIIEGEELERLISEVKREKDSNFSSFHTEHFIKNYNNCFVFLTHNKFFNGIERQIKSYGDNIEQQSDDNQNGVNRARTGYYGEYILNMLLGQPSLNIDTYSSLSVVKSQSDTGHLNCRLECKTRHLYSSKSHLVFKDSENFPHNCDECLISIEKVTNFNELLKYKNDYSYLVVVHGILEYEILKYYQNQCQIFEPKSKKICLCKEIYDNLIPIGDYFYNDFPHMVSLYHFLNATYDYAYVDLMNLCICLYLQKYFKFFKDKDGLDLRIYTDIKDNYRLVYKRYLNFLRDNSLENKYPDCENRNYNIKGLFPTNGNKYSFYNFSLHIDSKIKKSSLKVIRTEDLDFSFINNKKCSEGVVEDFLYENNIFKFPLMGYGIRGIFGKIQKGYLRPLNNNGENEKTCCFMDFFDIISAIFPHIISDSSETSTYPKQFINTDLKYNWECRDLLNNIIQDIWKDIKSQENSNYNGLELQDIYKDYNILISNIKHELENNKLSEVEKENIKIIPLFFILNRMLMMLPFYSDLINMNETECDRVYDYLPNRFITPDGLIIYGDCIKDFLCKERMPNIILDYKSNGKPRIGKKIVEMLEKKDNEDNERMMGNCPVLIDTDGESVEKIEEQTELNKNWVDIKNKENVSEGNKKGSIDMKEIQSKEDSEKDSEDLAVEFGSMTFGSDVNQLEFGVENQKLLEELGETNLFGNSLELGVQDVKTVVELEKKKDIENDKIKNLIAELGDLSSLSEDVLDKILNNNLYFSLLNSNLNYTEDQINDMINRGIVDSKILIEIFRLKILNSVNILNNKLITYKNSNREFNIIEFYSLYQSLLSTLNSIQDSENLVFIDRTTELFKTFFDINS